MNAHHDRLDAAIDAIAARLTEVTDNDGFALQIANALPERSMWLGFGWTSRLGMVAIALAVTVGVVLRTSDDRSTKVLRTEVPSSPTVARGTIVERPPRDRGTIVETPLIVRRTAAEPPSNDRRTADVPDFDRSLPALEAASMLTLESLAPVTLAEDAPLTVLPLAIADLPLTAENNPQKSVEEQR